MNRSILRIIEPVFWLRGNNERTCLTREAANLRGRMESFTHQELVEDIVSMSHDAQLPTFCEKMSLLSGHNYKIENESLIIAQKLQSMGQPNSGWFDTTQQNLHSHNLKLVNFKEELLSHLTQPSEK